MIQDLGASFGPPKVNLARWRDLPVWHDRASCTLSMRALPYEGATFEDTRVSEAGRALAASRLSAISDEQIERIFFDARFPQFQAGTDAERDLKAWTGAFKSRVSQIENARCPEENSQRPTPKMPGDVALGVGNWKLGVDRAARPARQRWLSNFSISSITAFIFRMVRSSGSSVVMSTPAARSRSIGYAEPPDEINVR